MLYLEQTKACQIFSISCFNSLKCEIPSSEIKVKTERTNFYETLYKKALECANNGDLIQQTAQYNKQI